MSTPNNAPECSATNDEWTGSDFVGGIWDESMFPHAPRDSRFYGPQDPLDLVLPSGPFDDKDGDEAWRDHGTGIYTGDGFVKSSGPPSAREQARRRNFWKSYDTQSAAAAAAGSQDQRPILGQPLPAASEQLRFPDALPVRSVTPPALLAQHQISRRWPDHSSLPTLRALVSNSAAASISAPATASATTPSSSPPVPAGASHHSSDVDSEYELDDDCLPDAPQGPPASANTVDPAQLSRTSSPRAINDWDDYNLLTLWKHKIIRKKGYEPMLTSFENQTVESLHEAWTTHKERCRVLGAAWEAAGKPNGPLSEWFEK